MVVAIVQSGTWRIRGSLCFEALVHVPFPTNVFAYHTYLHTQGPLARHFRTVLSSLKHSIKRQTLLLVMTFLQVVSHLVLFLATRFSGQAGTFRKPPILNHGYCKPKLQSRYEPSVLSMHDSQLISLVADKSTNEAVSSMSYDQF